ncbi:efflux RND transporter periplasmic adaptor subunit [Shewanella surugensis]|uniref:Efflux RND transporter periplasmic adaptor subunit n=1 Tax=Shewanella surugensis TaxID=212020 RepID=A0ABT0L6M8_9GAMM|nr:efflux RND transporter periplasmic adaptor subunit [Shewanella surugensis]MCL1123349.1 efflux RND transporter periplasmic adaptor subunit [Shewanella surugensis]
MNINIKSLLIGLVIGAVVILAYYQFIAPVSTNNIKGTAPAERKILYWVAPMDANYTRDKPGKSPMGMDLIPVYDEGGKGPDAGPGTIRISPDVVNNLGVRTVVVGYSALHSEIDTVGYVAYDEDTIIHIHPRVEGWIERLHVKAVGDPVKEGEALYDIYSPELVNGQEELLLALDRKNKRLMKAAEDRLLALQLPQSVINQLIKNKKVQQTITFYSPQDGVIEKLDIREGFYVKPGSTLMSIGNLADVWVEAEIFESQAAQVRVGMPVVMTLDYLPGKVFKSKINYVYPSLDAKSRTMKVRLLFNNEDGEFKPNMFAHIRIDVSAGNKALLIPKEALIRTGSQDRVVLALGEGHFKSVAVTAGRFDENDVEILSGLYAGEKVVSSAQFLLDSESSKTSDFKRMDHDMSDMNDRKNKTGKNNVATASGVINVVMMTHNMLNISRGPIKKWGRPAATMDFIVNKAIDMTALKQGMKVEFTFEVKEGEFIINKITILNHSLSSDKPAGLDAHVKV